MAVRLDKTLRATIDKVVASYNRKIAYYYKKGIRGLPQKTSYQDIVNLGSRKLIKNELKALSKLNKNTVKNFLQNNKFYSIYEEDKIATRITRSKRALKNRIQRLAKIEYKKYGKKAGFTMGDKVVMEELYGSLGKGYIKSDKLISSLRKYERLSRINAKSFLELTDSEKESYVNLLNRIDNPYVNPDLKKNYLDALTDLGYHYKYDSKKLAELEKKLKGLTPEQFEKVFTEDLGVRRILSYYDIMRININNGLGVEDRNRQDVFDIYDNIYSNIDQIIKEL